MTLYNGIDTVSVAMDGDFSLTYGPADNSNIASLFVSDGLLEASPLSLPIVAERRVFVFDDAFRVFVLEVGRRVFRLATSVNVFEKDTRRRVFKKLTKIKEFIVK